MKRNIQTQKNTSSFALKQQFIVLLSRELNNCGFNIILGFESTFNERICTLKFSCNKQLEICVNLSHVKKSIDDASSSSITKVHYCALFIADYIQQMERVRNTMPQNYFEGLVFFNAIDIYKSPKVVSVYSPLRIWNKKPKRTQRIRPIEISCAINALNRIRLFALPGINEKDKNLIEVLVDKLLLYASLPEVAYVNTSIPVYSMVDAFKSLSTIIANDPKAVQEFPILTLAPFEQINQLTIKDLLLSCVQSNNNFLIGIAIRIIAFLQLPDELEGNKSVFEKLVEAMSQYIEYSLTYYKELSDSRECLLKDNLYAIKKAVKAINDYLKMYGYDVASGNIHSIG